jgi:hypothetical protein
MKEDSKTIKVINSFSRGVLIGLLICLIFNFAYKTENFYVFSVNMMQTYGANFSMLILIVFSGTVSLVSSLSATIFKNENRSLFVNTVIHFLLMQIVVGFFVIIFNLKSIYIIFFIISTIVYCVIWFSIYHSIKIEIINLNKNLKNRK